MLCSSMSRVLQGFLGRATGSTLCVNKFLRTESPTIVHGDAHEIRAKSASTRSDDVDTLKSVKDMPGPEGLCSLPYIGSMFLFHPFTDIKLEKSHLMFAELHRKYGRIVKFRKGLEWSVILFDPDLIEEAMSLEGTYPKRPSPPLYEAYSKKTGRKKGISQVHGEDWWKMRKPLQEFLLQPANVNLYTPALNEVSNDLISTIARQRRGNGSLPSLAVLMLNYAVESSAVYCINTRLGYLQNGNHSSSHVQDGSNPTDGSQCPYSGYTDDFRRLSDKERSQLLDTIKIFMAAVGDGYYTFPLYKYFPTKLYNDFAKAIDYLSYVVQTRINELAVRLKDKGQRPDEVTDRPNLLQSLLQDGRVDPTTTAITLTGFFTTATDNISNSLGILLWHLAKNPSKQTRLRDEINSLVTSKRNVDADTLSHIPFLKACLKESHRITFPTPGGGVRVMLDDVNIGSYHIPAGTCVHFGHNVLGHSAEYFENPEEYIPERWLKLPVTQTDTLRKRRQSIITMPFGFGRRNCIGRRLAEQQIYLALIKILQNYHLQLADPNEELDIVYKITAMSSKPLDIRFNPLHQ